VLGGEEPGGEEERRMDITPEGFAQSVQHLQPLGTLVLRSTDGKVLTSSGDLQGENGQKVRNLAAKSIVNLKKYCVTG
jgi:hypothetical protein